MGDTSQPAELSLTAITEQRSYAPIPDGGHVALITGGQGSRMFVINVKANNIELCGASVRSQLTDPSGVAEPANEVLRNLVVDDDGAAVLDGTDPTRAIFFPLCPTPGDGGSRWTVDVTVRDKAGHSAQAKSQVFVKECECRFFPPCDGGN